jgi:hypothetical protein
METATYLYLFVHYENRKICVLPGGPTVTLPWPPRRIRFWNSNSSPPISGHPSQQLHNWPHYGVAVACTHLLSSLSNCALKQLPSSPLQTPSILLGILVLSTCWKLSGLLDTRTYTHQFYSTRWYQRHWRTKYHSRNSFACSMRGSEAWGILTC